MDLSVKNEEKCWNLKKVLGKLSAFRIKFEKWKYPKLLILIWWPWTSFLQSISLIWMKNLEVTIFSPSKSHLMITKGFLSNLGSNKFKGI